MKRYNTEELFEKAKEFAKRKDDDKKLKNVVFFEDIIAHLGIAKSTFYEHIPYDSDGYKELESILQENKSFMKSGIRNKWYQCDHPNAWKYLYLLIGNEDERHALHGSKTENKTEVSGSLGIVWNEEKTYTHETQPQANAGS